MKASDSGDVPAANASSMDAQLRDLATTMQQMVDKGMAQGFAIRKAIITAVNAQTVPPSVSLNISGDTQTSVDQVRMVNNFNPQVGQTVLLAKQKQDIFILGAIAASGGNQVGPVDTGWKRATLGGGSHGGNSNGDIYYRRVLDNGSWKMQWRGGWNVSGTTVITGLDPEFRPTSKRSVLVARDPQGGSNVAQVDFNTNGTATLVGGTTNELDVGNHSHFVSIGVSGGVSVSVSVSGSANASGTTGSAGSTPHTHSFSGSGSSSGSGGGSGSFSGSGSANTGGGGGHSHPVNSPTWISLNGVEFFL